MKNENPFARMEDLDLDELADVISQRVRNPITIEDFNHRLIAYSTHEDCTDQARMETIMGRRVPEAVINRLWQDGVIQQLMASDEPIHITERREVGLGNRVAISIRKAQSVLGYIWVQVVNKPLENNELGCLSQAARAAMPRLYQRQTKRRILEVKSKEFFWELLLGSVSSHHEIQAKSEDIGLRLPKPFTVYIFEVDHPSHEDVHKEMAYLLVNLKDSFSLTQFPLWVTNQKHLIILGGGGDPHEEFYQRSQAFIREMLSRIQERFGSVSMHGVAGGTASKFQLIEQSYQQALAVLRMKKGLPEETAAIQAYADLGMYRLFPFIAEKNAKEGYRNFRLEKLRTYDEDNETELLPTLEAYLDSAGRMNITAQKLHVHPNTLAYRLKRISEVGGIDLEEQNQRNSLFMDIKLNKFQSEE
jgi:DNA-binding PucR family transcriptional regulator